MYIRLMHECYHFSLCFTACFSYNIDWLTVKQVQLSVHMFNCCQPLTESRKAMMKLEDDFVDGNFELPQESEPTAEQEACPTPKKRAALADIDTNIEPADKKPEKSKDEGENRGSKEKKKRSDIAARRI